MPLPWKTATACVLRKESRVLLVNYTNFPHPIHEGYYAPPGGKLNEREDPCAGTRREVQEETGIIVGPLFYRGTVKFHNEQRTKKTKPFKYNFEVFIYECRDFDMSTARLTEGNELVWVEHDRFMLAPLSAGDRMLWHWIYRYASFEGSLRHVGEQLAEYHVCGVLPDSRREE